MISPLLLMVACGALVGWGLFVAGRAVVPAHVRLGDVFDQLDGRSGRGSAPASVGGDSGLERLGTWGYQKLRLPLSESTQRLLALQGRSISDFFAEKAVWTLAGFFVPVIFAAVDAVMGGPMRLWPVGVGVLGGILGFFVADVRLRRSSTRAQQGASEGLFMFFDLVALERLANRSVTQALQSVSTVSDAPIFARIRTSLDRARLEQVPPWHELHRLADELQVPMLGDMADVLKLDEQGAALAEPLRARVKELRDANLTELKIAAQAQTERMTLWMTLPTMVFALIFLAPPLLRLVTGGP